MLIYHYILITAVAICVGTCIIQFFQAIRKKEDFNYAEPKGKSSPAIAYSLTKAMSPTKKETAFKHLPTYTAGMFFHIGTFLSLFLLIIHFFEINIHQTAFYITSVILALSVLSVFSILIKRIINPKSRGMSNADDYFSNILVTGFQVISCLALLFDNFLPTLFIYSSIMLLYIPLGKLRHTVYFFAARIQLGRNYGYKGVWPPQKSQ